MPFKLGIIGLDTSHTIEFTRLIQGDAPADQRIGGLQVVNAMRFPSAFQTEEGQDKRQQQLEAWGVKVSRSLAETVTGMDGLLIEINDPALHLEYFTKVADLGLPVFLDKPLAGSLADGRRIVALAREKGVRVWGASSIRFMRPLAAARAAVGEPQWCHVYGALGKAAAGSDLVWYGIHTFEMLTTVMGRGAERAFARQDSRGIITTVQFSGNRRGVAECNAGSWVYGGVVQGAKQLETFDSRTDPGLYHHLIEQVRDFFVAGRIPVPMDETLEIAATIAAAECSLQSGREEPVTL